MCPCTRGIVIVNDTLQNAPGNVGLCFYGTHSHASVSTTPGVLLPTAWNHTCTSISVLCKNWCIVNTLLITPLHSLCQITCGLKSWSHYLMSIPMSPKLSNLPDFIWGCATGSLIKAIEVLIYELSCLHEKSLVSYCTGGHIHSIKTLPSCKCPLNYCTPYRG